MMKRYGILLSVFAIGANAAAQPPHYDFQTETCKATVTYDASQDAEAVKNTADFLFGFFNFGAEQKGSEIDLCRTRVSRLRSARFVDLVSVKALVADMSDGTEAYCELQTLEKRAAHEPALLREFPSSEACYPAVDALEGKTDTVQFWREMIAEHATRSGDPQGFLAKQHAHESAPDFQDWVRQQILTYGWHNCANGTLEHFRASERQYRAEAEQEFSRKFHLTEFDCDTSSVD